MQLLPEPDKSWKNYEQLSSNDYYCWVDLEGKLKLTDKILSTQIHLQVVQVQNAVLLEESCCLILIFIVWQWLAVILCKLYL